MELNGRDLFERIMRKEYPVMIKAACTVLESPSEAEEVVLSILESICRNPHKLDRVKNLRGYLATAARDAALLYKSKPVGEPLSPEEVQGKI